MKTYNFLFEIGEKVYVHEEKLEGFITDIVPSEVGAHLYVVRFTYSHYSLCHAENLRR